MIKARKLILATLLALTLVAVGCGWWRTEPEAKIRISGNIELTQINVAFKTAGKLIELQVEEGMPVRKGMVLARIDPTQLERQKSREQAGLLATESQLEQLHTSISQQKASVAAEMQLRQAELKQAEARLQEQLSGSRKQEIEQAKAALQDVRTQHLQAQKDWDRAQTLYKDEDISTAQYDQFRTRSESTAALVRQAEERLALVTEGPRKEVIDAARAAVERARAAVSLTEATRLEIKRREQELGTRRAEIERARAQVAVVEAQLDDTTIASPIDGVVLVKSAELGEVLAPGAAAATIGDIDHPWLRGYINEPDLGKIKLGANARITSDSYPGKVYRGRVSFISSEAEFTPKQIQTPEERVKLVYRIKLEVENPQHELKLNMPADAEIELGK